MFTRYLTPRVAEIVKRFCKSNHIHLEDLDKVFNDYMGCEYTLLADYLNDWDIVPTLHWFCLDYPENNNLDFVDQLEYIPSSNINDIYDENPECIKIYDWLENKIT